LGNGRDQPGEWSWYRAGRDTQRGKTGNAHGNEKGKEEGASKTVTREGFEGERGLKRAQRLRGKCQTKGVQGENEKPTTEKVKLGKTNPVLIGKCG